jgi:Flp pilus assembly protein TadG
MQMGTRKLRFGGAALGRVLASFGADRRGATAATIAISMAVLAPVTLGVVDVYVASEQKGKLQDALDAATLSAARSTATTDADIDAVGDKALLANLALIPGATLTNSSFRLVDTKIIAQATISLPAMGPIFNQGAVNVGSEVQRAGKIEVALVLDNTGSMAGQKLTSLKSAAKSLVDKLVAASAHSTDADPLKISLVPFSSSVRVQGTTLLTGTNYNTTSHSGAAIPTWIDPQGVAHHNAGVAYDTFDVQTDRLAIMKNWGGSWSGCVEARMAPYDIQETAPTAATPATMFVPYFWPDELDTSNASSNAVNDYVLDNANGGSYTTSQWKQREQRAAKYATATWKNSASNSFMSGYNFGPNAGCGMQPMIRLTNNAATIKTAIDNMTAIGDTNIPIGLMWGWHSLSPNAPLADGAPYGTESLR